MKKVKNLSLKILIPILLIATLAYGTYSPEQELKPVVVVSALPDHIPADSSVMIVTNRIIDLSDPDQVKVGNYIDSADYLHYAIAIERMNHFEVCFVDNLKQLIELFPAGNLSVFVHGDGKILNKTLWRTSLMKQAYKTNLLVFSWPTRVPEMNGLKNFKNSISNAEYSSKHLSIFLHEFNQYKFKTNGVQIAHTSILFHSLGNYLLEKTVRTGLLNDMGNDLFDAVILNAAATHSEGHDEWVSRLHIQKDIYVISNKHDMNLKGAQYFTSLPLLLGQKPKGKKVEGVHYIDMSDAMGFTLKRSKSHTYFVGDGPAENENIRKFYNRLITGNGADLKQLGHIDEKHKNFVISAENG